MGRVIYTSTRVPVGASRRCCSSYNDSRGSRYRAAVAVAASWFSRCVGLLHAVLRGVEGREGGGRGVHDRGDSKLTLWLRSPSIMSQLPARGTLYSSCSHTLTHDMAVD